MKNVFVGLAALAVSAVPALALDGPGRALVASDNLQAGTPALLVGGTGDSIERSFIPPYIGTVRVKFEIRSADGAAVGYSVGTNHLQFCEGTSSSMSFVLKTCNVRVAPGRALSVNAFPNSSDHVELRNVRVYYNVADFDGKPLDINFQAD